uniref:RWD domain-containing protein n=1 Tax=Mola mola TaxID=94237 RepID=A0A3Q3XDN0_MOLML
MDDLLVNRNEDGGWEVSLVLYPSTAEDSVAQFVRLTLTLTLDQQYPLSPPAISIHNPRGLSDDKLSRCLQLEAQSCLGSAVLYQLIEKAKEILTESNIPHGNCVICLYDFKVQRSVNVSVLIFYLSSLLFLSFVTKTQDHIFQLKNNAFCCLVVLFVGSCPNLDILALYWLNGSVSSAQLDAVSIGSSFQQKWSELQKLLERQRSKGGIIDPEVESNRFLIHINEVRGIPQAQRSECDFVKILFTSFSELVSPAAPPPVPSASHVSLDVAGVRADQFVSAPFRCRGGPAQRPARGPRRGGRSRPQHGRAAPISEHLDKLSLSSGRTEGAMKAGALGDPPMQGDAELCQSKTGWGVSTDGPETLVSADVPPACQAASNTEEAADSAGGRGHRGRRRGPHRPVQHAGAPGPSHCHWDARASRNRGGGNNPYSRGGGGGGGGPRRGFRHRVVDRERGREEVL